MYAYKGNYCVVYLPLSASFHVISSVITERSRNRSVCFKYSNALLYLQQSYSSKMQVNTVISVLLPLIIFQVILSVSGERKVKASILPYTFDDFYPSNYHVATSPPERVRHDESELWISPFERLFMHAIPNTDNNFRHHLTDFDELEKQSQIGKDGFQVNLDVQHFQPNEISVKAENNAIIVHAKHAEKRDEQGYIAREFTRRYELPKGYKLDDVISTLSSDGLLTLKCPNPLPAEVSNGRNIPIIPIGPAKPNVNNNEDKPDGNSGNNK